MNYKNYFHGFIVFTIVILFIQSGVLFAQTPRQIQKSKVRSVENGNELPGLPVNSVKISKPDISENNLPDVQFEKVGNDQPATAQKSLHKAEAVTVYDFTTGPDKYYNYSINPTVGAKDLGDGNWGMRAGDGDQDGYINASDKGNVWRVQNGTGGYLTGDFNLDGYVNATDIGNFWRVNNGTGTTVPE